MLNIISVKVKKTSTFKMNLSFLVTPEGLLYDPSLSEEWINPDLIFKSWFFYCFTRMCKLCSFEIKNPDTILSIWIYHLVTPEGFKPPTLRAEIWCAIQLRHGASFSRQSVHLNTKSILSITVLWRGKFNTLLWIVVIYLSKLTTPWKLQCSWR